MTKRREAFSGPEMRAFLEGMKCKLISPARDCDGQDGDIVIVAEAAHRNPSLWYYEADETEVGWPARKHLSYIQEDVVQSSDMPVEASRITLLVHSVETKRLWDITDEEALAAGVGYSVAPRPGSDISIDGDFWPGGPVRMLNALWELQHPPALSDEALHWRNNPSVLVRTVEVLRGNFLDTPVRRRLQGHVR